MASVGKLSREEKGKAVALPTSLTCDVTVNGSPIEDFSLIHRDAVRGERFESRDERTESTAREESEGIDSSRSGNRSERESGADTDFDRDGEISTSPIPSPHTLWLRRRLARFDLIDCRPTVYHSNGIFEDLPPLPPELLRDPWAEGQRWRNVFGTRSTHNYVRGLLRRFKGTGVTYVIPSPEQRPWSPPVGYQCLYEAYFEEDAKIWFSIPRLITSYVRRRGIAISQLKVGSIRNAVMLMVMAAEIDVPMSVRVFEELTSTKPRGQGLQKMTSEKKQKLEPKRRRQKQ